MATTLTTLSGPNPTDFTNRIQTLYSKKLLQALEDNLRLSPFGVPKEVPAHSGSYVIRFFRPRRASAGAVQILTEGTPNTTYTQVELGYVEATLKQRGANAKLTDIVTSIDLLDTLELYSKTMGLDAALDFDSICRNAICANSTVAAHGLTSGQTTLYDQDTKFERFAGVVNTSPADGASLADFTTMAALGESSCKMTRAFHLGCITQLKSKQVPMVGGKYPVLVPSEVLYDIRQDETWLNAAVQDFPSKRLYKWAEFELDGGVFIEHSNPFREAVGTYGTYAAAGEVLSSLYLGADAFGVPSMKGTQAGSNPASPSLTVLTKPDKADPAGQFITIAWKAYYTAILLYCGTSIIDDVPHCVQARTKSTFA